MLNAKRKKERKKACHLLALCYNSGTMKPKEALDLIGGLSKPSKMPGHAYSIPAVRCKTGGKLRPVKGSICSVCYALKGRYVFPNVQRALEKRFESMSNPLWVDAMVISISHFEKSGFFRWHDSGDVQNITHLESIVEIAKRLPHISFWLPTREYSIIGQYVLKHGSFPENLTVRLSSFMLEGPPPVSVAKSYGVQTSGVSKTGFTCPASKQGNLCGDCRACWKKDVDNVNYKQH